MRMWRLMAHGWSFKANCRGKSYSEIGSFSYKPQTLYTLCCKSKRNVDVKFLARETIINGKKYNPRNVLKILKRDIQLYSILSYLVFLIRCRMLHIDRQRRPKSIEKRRCYKRCCFLNFPYSLPLSVAFLSDELIYKSKSFVSLGLNITCVSIWWN